MMVSYLNRFLSSHGKCSAIVKVMLKTILSFKGSTHRDALRLRNCLKNDLIIFLTYS
jgi:hypothetical protein